MGRRRRFRGRALNGVLLLDKPADRSSNAAMQRARVLFDAVKAGHGGNLDPLASGMLPILFGESTKFAGGLLDADKQYLTTAALGSRSTTGDLEGEPFDHQVVPDDIVERVATVLPRFIGRIAQTPPMHSAIKQEGVPLYELARAGVTVPRPQRQVIIHALESLSCDGDSLTLRVRCSKGTYIRTLVEDLGEALGCNAHVRALRREWVHPFDTSAMVSLDAIEAARDAGPPESLDAFLLPIDSALVELPVYELGSDADRAVFQHGNLLDIDNPPVADGCPFRVYHGGDFLGVALCRNGRLRPTRLLRRPTA
ncbi:MAG: tRNA pseudouridine(55) synthase TruB [Pseudomonadota bacterium]